MKVLLLSRQRCMICSNCKQTNYPHWESDGAGIAHTYTLNCAVFEPRMCPIVWVERWFVFVREDGVVWALCPEWAEGWCLSSEGRGVCIYAVYTSFRLNWGDSICKNCPQSLVYGSVVAMRVLRVFSDSTGTVRGARCGLHLDVENSVPDCGRWGRASCICAWSHQPVHAVLRST